MCKKFSRCVVSFFFIVSILLLPSSVLSFWYGDQTLEETGVVTPTTCEDLNQLSAGFPVPGPLVGQMFGFNNNPDDEVGVVFADPERYWDGVVLLSCIGGCEHPDDPDIIYDALLVDMEGNFVNGWDNINAVPGKLLPNGDIMGGKDVATFGSTALVLQDWWGNEIWSWETPIPEVDLEIPQGGDPIVHGWHHDHNITNSPNGVYTPLGQKPHPQGKALVLAHHLPEENYYYPKGWVKEGHPYQDTSHISEFPLLDDAIYIVDNKGRITWQWFANEHFEEMEFSQEGKEAVFNVRAFSAESFVRSDWQHFNNVNELGRNKWCEDADDEENCDPRFNKKNLIFDSRNTGMIGIIDRETGEIVWKIGPDFETNGIKDAGEDAGPIIGPHNAHMINHGLPGAGNILVFDNGGFSGYGALEYAGLSCPPTFPNALRDYSRILEINPQTMEVVWSYKCNPDYDDCQDRKFFGSFISSVQRLPNGNTQITEGNMARVFEVTPENEIVWEYYAPALPGFLGALGTPVYRAYRYPKSYVVE